MRVEKARTKDRSINKTLNQVVSYCLNSRFCRITILFYLLMFMFLLVGVQSANNVAVHERQPPRLCKDNHETKIDRIYVDFEIVKRGTFHSCQAECEINSSLLF